MAVTIRLIPCLDVQGGRVVKGVNFLDLIDAGDPVELATHYAASGADELTFLDISASYEHRATTYEMVARCAESVFIPLTVGGGVRTVDDVDALLRSGADKVGINTAAIAHPELIDLIAQRFGNQVIVLSVDARKDPSQPSGYGLTTHGGRRDAGIDAMAWIKEAQERGAGEILLTSMDADGTTSGFDIEMITTARQHCSIPLIASGGAGELEDFYEAAHAGADALLAASVFHYGRFTIDQVKEYLHQRGIEVRKSPQASDLTL